MVLEHIKQVRVHAQATVGLLGLQLIAMMLSVISLPLLARTLGVGVFGSLMMAQSVAMLVTLFIDAGFNAESQRRLVRSEWVVHHVVNKEEIPWQILVDNLVLRGLVALPLTCIAVGVAWVGLDLPLLVLVVSCLNVLGTLLLPQWWLIGMGYGVQLGWALVVARLISVLGIVACVHRAQDLLLATFFLSIGSVFAGVLVSRQLWWPLLQRRYHVHLGEWVSYGRTVRPLILSAFFAQLSSTWPVLLLGFMYGTVQTGLFSAADRLTRAAAHLGHYIVQSMMRFFGRLFEQFTELQVRRYVLLLLLVLLLLGALCTVLLMWGSHWLIEMLYGQAFTQAAPIFAALCVWLCAYMIRQTAQQLGLSLFAKIHTLAKLQWVEVLLYLLFIVGALHYSAWNAALHMAIAMAGAEGLILLLTWGMLLYHANASRSIK